MMKNKVWYVIGAVAGVILIGACILLRMEEMKRLSGVALGIGCGLFSMAIANLIMLNGKKKRPDIMRQDAIEFYDERNTTIRNQAKAKSADITQWFIMGLAYITILIGAALWVTLVTVCIFLLYSILTSYFISKYQKEM